MLHGRITLGADFAASNGPFPGPRNGPYGISALIKAIADQLKIERSKIDLLLSGDRRHSDDAPGIELVITMSEPMTAKMLNPAAAYLYGFIANMDGVKGGRVTISVKIESGYENGAFNTEMSEKAA